MKKMIYRLLLTISIIAFLLSAFMVGKYFYEQYKSQSDFQTLSSSVQFPIRNSATLNEAPNQSVQWFDAYQKLYDQNQDFVGWIQIDDTKINYPVMQTVSDPEFYLHRNFEKLDSSHGTPFIDYRNELDPRSDNILLYGHHMKDGTMFADLIQYTDYDYFESHPIIRFDTLNELSEYQIVAVFKTPSEGENVFFYNDYLNFTDEQDFETYRQEVQNRSFYDTGVDFQFGDKLLTLSTCEYTLANNGRLAVVAKKTTSIVKE
ncbi:class B sortase [Scatolibacter rhodanostii]|uniref:class B sortase n=1 Tax=Scatolibacter rhodanostii TaxID=2014781 RepID=UPI000C084891|nr:class B sortase [Scatolibacter rhodanostii]